MKELVELGIDDKPKTKGEQYKLLNDSALYTGELMQADKLAATNLDQKALNGQDFFVGHTYGQLRLALHNW